MIPALLSLAAALLAGTARSHDVPTSRVTYNHEVREILEARCISCHRDGGSAFSLASYADARPWAKAIEEEVLARRMPPWGAVQGFAEFRNDPSLTTTQIQQIAEWAEGGVPEGELESEDEHEEDEASEAGQLAAVSPGTAAAYRAVPVTGGAGLRQPLTAQGLEITRIDRGATFRLTAALPDGTIAPLLWMAPYDSRMPARYLFRAPLPLPAGTVIRGLPAGVQLSLLVAGQ